MTRIEKTFQALTRPALITFVTACDPDYDRSLSLIKTHADAGADIIEIGMPFTDPAADGPTVEAASHRALAAGGSMVNTLKIVREFRAYNDTLPIVLMGYLNPVLQYGYESFARDAAKAGVDGLIVVDVPPEESDDLMGHLKTHKIDMIRLITPTTDEKRLQTILKDASGFLYCVSIAGITGTASANSTDIAKRIHDIKQATDMPVAVGFGIKTPQDAAEMGAVSDAVIVASSIIQNMVDNMDSPDLNTIIHKQVSDLAAALKS